MLIDAPADGGGRDKFANSLACIDAPADGGGRDKFANSLAWEEDRVVRPNRCGLCGVNGQLGDEHLPGMHLEAILAAGETYELVTDRYVWPDETWRHGMEAMIEWLTTEGYEVRAMRRHRVAPCGTLAG